MRVLHIITTLEMGGAQSVLVGLLERWADRHDEHMVASLRHAGPLSARIEALGIPVEEMHLTRNALEPGKLRRFVHIIRQYRPDIIQTWLYHADLIGSAAARLAGRAPIIWGIHHTTENRDSLNASSWVIVRLLSLLSGYVPSKIICCSDSAYRTHLALGYRSEKLTTIANGIDTDLFRPNPDSRRAVRSELGLLPGTKLIGMFARFHPQKAHGTFIRAAGLLLHAHPDVHFVLSGLGIDQSNEELMRTIVQERVGDHLHLLGARQDMPRLNAGMDIVTLSSSYGEALPMSIGEAMACGVPCVGTDVGSTIAMIGDTGAVVGPNDPSALADAWQSLLRLPADARAGMGQRARHRIQASFDLSSMVAAYKRTYRQLAPAS